MLINQIFKEGWFGNVLLYGTIYLLAEYMVYKLIFKTLVGQPKNFSWKEIRFWSRKANFIGAVVFAPLFEEFMFTYLCYASFLRFAQSGSEGIVLIMVAGFFALLHLPGDLRGQRSRRGGINYYHLFKFQLQRFFFSMSAFFIFTISGTLWITILLHYFYNAIVSVYQYDRQDIQFFFRKKDLNLTLILGMNAFFAFFSAYQFYGHSPELGQYLFIFAAIALLDTAFVFRRV